VCHKEGSCFRLVKRSDTRHSTKNKRALRHVTMLCVIKCEVLAAHVPHFSQPTTLPSSLADNTSGNKYNKTHTLYTP
jgi:hypothetical protein